MLILLDACRLTLDTLLLCIFCLGTTKDAVQSHMIETDPRAALQRLTLSLSLFRVMLLNWFTRPWRISAIWHWHRPWKWVWAGIPTAPREPARLSPSKLWEDCSEDRCWSSTVMRYTHIINKNTTYSPCGSWWKSIYQIFYGLLVHKYLECLRLLMFSKVVSSAHQGCISLIKNTVKVKYYCRLK